MAYYPFNGDANDVSGNENHGVVSGATLVADRDGNPNSAYQFNGLSDVITIPNSDSIKIPAGADLTVAAWGFRTSSSWPLHLLGKRVGCGSGLNFYQLAIGTNAIPPSSAPVIEWVHYAVTVQGNTVVHYVNGNAVLTTLLSVGTNTADLKIGTSGACAGFAGIIDEVRVYNYALTDSEMGGLAQ